MALDQCHGGDGIAGWPLSIVKTECLMLLLVKRRMPLLYIDDNRREGQRRELRGNIPDPEHEVMTENDWRGTKGSPAHASPVAKGARVADLEELSITDVAEQLRISVPAAKSRLLRARQELRKRLTAYYRSASRKKLNPATRAMHLRAYRVQVRLT